MAGGVAAFAPSGVPRAVSSISRMRMSMGGASDASSYSSSSAPPTTPTPFSRRGALRKLLTATMLVIGMPHPGKASLGACAEGDDVCLAASQSASKMPQVQVGSLSISPIVMGQWQLAGGHGEYDPIDAVDNMVKHFDAGITSVDTADIYGPSEEIVGLFLKERPAAVVCTKFCCFRDLRKIDKKMVKDRILASCKRLGVKQLDLVAFFWLDFGVKRYVQVAQWLSELRDEGLIREIGVTNFDTESLKQVVDAGVPVVSNQIQYSIVDRRAQNGLAEYCDKNKIKLLCYGAMGGGLFSDGYLGKAKPSSGSLDTSSLRMYSSSIARFGGWDLFQRLLGAMSEVAKKHDVSVANVAARYVLDQQAVGSIIVGVRNTKHIQDNLRSFTFLLDEDDRSKIDDVLVQAKGPKGDIYGYERGLVG